MMDCTCKGIRFCASCRNSERISKLNLIGFKDNSKQCWLFNDGYAHFIQELYFESTIAQIYQNQDHIKVTHKCSIDSNKCFPMDGVLLINDFLLENEEQDLIQKIDNGKWKPSQSGRRKQDYGPRVNFKKKKLSMETYMGLPEYLDFLLFKIQNTHTRLNNFVPVELCNLEYFDKKFSSIDMHKDDDWIWGERLISINLLNDSLITLRNGNIFVFVPLHRRSLLCLTGSERYDWEHGIFPHHILGRRIAITLRERGTAFLEGGKLFEQFGRELLAKSRQRI